MDAKNDQINRFCHEFSILSTSTQSSVSDNDAQGPVIKGYEFEQTQGDSDRQRSLEGCRSWGHKELNTT